jgi:hypothetical protein
MKDLLDTLLDDLFIFFIRLVINFHSTFTDSTDYAWLMSNDDVRIMYRNVINKLELSISSDDIGVQSVISCSLGRAINVVREELGLLDHEDECTKFFSNLNEAWIDLGYRTDSSIYKMIIEILQFDFNARG